MNAASPPTETGKPAVDFHFNVDHPVIYACRVVRKARNAGHSVLVYSRDADRIAKVDVALWTFSALDFLPHVYADSPLAPLTPVWLTLAPIDRRLVDLNMLTGDELSWLNEYHERVRHEVRPHVDEATRIWLEAATAPLSL